MAGSGFWYELGKALRRILLQGSSGSQRAQATNPKQQPQATLNAPRPNVSVDSQRPYDDVESPGQYGAGATRDVRRDELAEIHIEYSPSSDGDPDPGEVVWTWVPYVENDGRGKDRPVLIVGRLPGGAVVGCYLSTKQHRGFVSVGTGGWDSKGRESFLSPERLLRITDEGMRREGHVIGQQLFAAAVAVVAKEHGLRI